MPNSKPNDIKLTFIGIISFWIIIMVAITVSNIYVKNKTKNNLLYTVETLTTNINQSVNEEINEKLNVLKITAKYLTKENLEKPNKIVKGFNEIIEQNGFQEMGIAYSDGTSYLNTGEIINLKDRQYFQNSMNGIEHVSYLVDSKLYSKVINVYSVPVIKDDKVMAVLWASILTEDFYSNLDIEIMNQFGDIYIIDDSGNLICGVETSDYNFFKFIQTDENYNKNKENLNAMIQDMNNLEDNSKMFVYDGKKSYLYYTKLSYNNWWVLTKIYDNTVEELNRSVISTTTRVSFILAIISSTGIFLFGIKWKKVNNYLRSIAYTDNITKGNNDIYFKEYLKKYIDKKDNFAFINLEIMNIKSAINILGFKNVHYILSNFYEEVFGVLEEKEIIAHSYLGEYKLLLHYKDIDDLIQKVENIYYNKKDKNLEIKMGIYIIEKTDVEFEDMIGFANIAKENIPSNQIYAIYSKQMHKKEMDKIKLEEDIKYGIENKEFKAWFQPKYGEDKKTLVGAEALVRWYKYESIISPYIFIPICEARGYIQQIDELVLEDVCKNLRIWQDENKKIVPISVNLSRKYLDSEDLIDRLERIINKYNIPKDFIQFEITESSFAGNENKLRKTIKALQEKNFKLLLDDFGTGYSSIKTIADMDFDILKIDKSFIDGIGKEKWENIILYTIALSQNLNMDVIAEGIETEEQYQFLLKCKCNKFQGYYFNKPIDADTFSVLLSKQTDDNS